MRLMRIILMGGAVGAAVAAALLSGVIEHASLLGLDGLFVLRGPREPAVPVVIVTIDEDSMDELDLAWPWPRSVHGRLLDMLRSAKPRVVAFDLVFSEASSHGEEDDLVFSRAIARAGNVVLAAAPTLVQDQYFEKLDPNLPIPVLRSSAAAVGAVLYPLDVDARVRRAVVEVCLETDCLPSFPQALLDPGGEPISSGSASSGQTFIINYRGRPGTYPHVPYHRVLSGEVEPELFTGKVVLIGVTTQIGHDVFSTPFAPANRMPGVEIHANAFETIRLSIPIREPARALVAALAIVAALAAVWAATSLRPLIALAILGASWLAIAGVSLILFTVRGVWLDMAGITLAAVLGYGVAVVVGFVQEQRERRRLSRFFSPAVVTAIVGHRTDAHLAISRREVTVLFSDIRGFTTLSERMPPEQVAEFLFEYFTELTAIVFGHGGMVDKYIGDCLMALYNVPLDQPDHAAEAVRTAVEFQQRTHELAARWAPRLGTTVGNGVGIHTGEAVVGAMGSRQRLEYTAVGDAVNLAARLESLTKELQTPIIISEATYALLSDEFETKPLGEVTVKGRTAPVRVYAVRGAREVQGPCRSGGGRLLRERER